MAGGGAAGFFAAITCAEANPAAKILLCEKSSEFLTKVRISGGGRCNVTHSCFDPRELSKRYPRGGRALIGAFHRFQPRDTIEWFKARGVTLKTESDGRMFPMTDQSETIVQCLLTAAREAGVDLKNKVSVESAQLEGSLLSVRLSDGTVMDGARLLIATGGARAVSAVQIASSLGHKILDPVPSLFTFHLEEPWLTQLPGVSVVDAEVKETSSNLRERGPILITHTGLSGPAVLRLSAWGARVLHALDYHFEVIVNWIPSWNEEQLRQHFREQRESSPGRLVMNSPAANLPSRLWEVFCERAGIGRETRWAILPKTAATALVELLFRCRLKVRGKSLNKEEFVTCGGVVLKEVDFQTMQSRICPGLYFAGEVLDIDGITGGFNFQAAWTTGFIAGKAMAFPE